MTLTAKDDIKFSFGEIDGSWTAAQAGDELELLEDLGETLNVRNKGVDFYVSREQVLQS